MKEKKSIIQFNSPVILSFVAISFLVLVLGTITGGQSDLMLFCVYRSSFKNPLSYFRLFGHVLGHANFEHYFNNMCYILLLGPAIEEKYGHSDTILMILLTGLATGLVHILVSPYSALLGASGVVFCFIIISSMTGFEKGIPVTLILIIFLFLGKEIYNAFFVKDNVSQLTHIVGGFIGCGFGFLSKKVERK